MQVGIILGDFTPKVIGHRNAKLEVISAQEVEADAVPGVDKRHVTVIHIDVWSSL